MGTDSAVQPEAIASPKVTHLGECIEILSVDLLNEHRPLVDALKRFSSSIGLELGWHYLLDLVWIISRLDLHKEKILLDAGAGTGVLQWFIAGQGASVISVDRMSRASLPLRFRRRFRVNGLRSEDLRPSFQVFLNNFGSDTSGNNQRSLISRLAAQTRELAGYLFTRRSSGSVIIYNQDLANLEDIQSGSVDTIVAVSALEHNSQEGLRLVIKELMRVLKPDGRLVATLVAAKEKDHWHEPSQAWCYGAESLKQIFELPNGTPSNYEQYDQLFAKLRDCSELRDGLARFYYKSGSTGMPWGKWDPQYQPVGVCKIKKALS